MTSRQPPQQEEEGQQDRRKYEHRKKQCTSFRFAFAALVGIFFIKHPYMFTLPFLVIPTIIICCWLVNINDVVVMVDGFASCDSAGCVTTKSSMAHQR